jgi:hypothetical protein
MDDGFARAGAEVQIDVRSGANGTGWDQLEILIYQQASLLVTGVQGHAVSAAEPCWCDPN